MRSQLDKVIKLAAKTGDKIIVIDEQNDKSLVIMSLADYENLLSSENKGKDEIKNLTEEELLDKINRDITRWKEMSEDKKFFASFADEGDSDDACEGCDDDCEDNSGNGWNGCFVPKEINNFSEDETIEFSKEIEEEKIEPAAGSADDKEDEMYYYHEPEKADISPREDGFTSVKDEIRARRNSWEIPETVKKKADAIPF